MSFSEKWAIDRRLVSATLFLSLFGIAMIYSAGQVEVPNVVTERAWLSQLRWLLVALLGFTVLSRIPMPWIEWAAHPIYVLGIILLGVTLIIGEGRGTAAGVKSFIRLGGFGFQPAEIAKIATILWLAQNLSDRDSPLRTLRDLVKPGAIVALPLGLVMLQPDLGTSLAFVGILFAMLYWAATPVWLLALVASPVVGLFLAYDTVVWSTYILIVIACMVLFLRSRLFLFESVALVLANFASATLARPLWNSLANYQRNRILVFLDPEVDPRGAGYQVIQSKVAIGSGEFWGQGFTQGAQKRLDFLPEQHTDFIFSVVGEELGFVGTTLLILLFGYVLIRLLR
ncbi:MAG TPA: rod shape-determining protein RodA, partial [Gemmatimonadetes bacterium]|nr:rod shape-determining protein RodA [Gemmatimonadota bacterium]